MAVNIADWIKSLKSPGEKPVELSYSRLSAFMFCPVKFRLIYEEGWKEKLTPQSSLGLSLHRALEQFHISQGSTFQALRLAGVCIRAAHDSLVHLCLLCLAMIEPVNRHLDDSRLRAVEFRQLQELALRWFREPETVGFGRHRRLLHVGPVAVPAPVWFSNHRRRLVLS